MIIFIYLQNLLLNIIKENFFNYLGSNFKPKLINTGYLKLDNVIKKLKKYRLKKNKNISCPNLKFNDE